jgi:hypothetical protein
MEMANTKLQIAKTCIANMKDNPLRIGITNEGEPLLARIHAARSQGPDELRRLRLECQVFAPSKRTRTRRLS